MSSIIFPLDKMVQTQAIYWHEKLHSKIAFFKVGLELFTVAGPRVLGFIAPSQCMLDLKLYDIPTTMARATYRAVELGVPLLTIHASAGKEAMRACTDVVKHSMTNVVAVTILTSQPFDEYIFKSRVDDAVASGVTHFVCSPQPREIRYIKQNGGKIVITPGISLSGEQRDDQVRVNTPRAAKENGADYLVIGRPIRDAENPLGVVRQINEETGVFS